MKQFISFIVILTFIVTTFPLLAEDEDIGDIAKDNAFDRVGDWFATLGKEGLEKQSILAQRKAKRIAKRVEKQAKNMQKKLSSRDKTRKGQAFTLDFSGK